MEDNSCLKNADRVKKAHVKMNRVLSDSVIQKNPNKQNKKPRKISSVGSEGLEKLEHLCIAGRNVK